MPTLSPELQDWLDQRRAGLSLAGARSEVALSALLLASDYAFEQLRRHPEWLTQLDAPPQSLELAAEQEAGWPSTLRQFRHRHSLALIAREVSGAPLESSLAHSSWLADHCCQQALNALFNRMVQRHGRPLGRSGEPVELVVMGLGKLGGNELNFSSDIDLVFAYPEGGMSDGGAALDNETYFQRLGQRLIQLLGEVTADGFGFRVDMRLRPFGNAGRLALSFAAMEQYYQRDGRDWERYAWIKARPIAGDVVAGQQLLQQMRPFVFRRYLDYTAFEGLREMKAMIEAEVQRKDLSGHLKLGAGGIREIEFVVQLQQMIRGGREPSLRQSGLLSSLAELEYRGHIPEAAAERLRQAYRFLRRLENRVQMLRDEQTHTLPTDPLLRGRLAAGLGFADWAQLLEQLEQHRSQVRREFSRVFEARQRSTAGPQLARFQGYWQALQAGDAGEAELAELGFTEPERVHSSLHTLIHQMESGAASARARKLLDRLMPELLAGAASQERNSVAAQRLAALVQAVLRRASYLALLDEQPAALKRLTEVMAGSVLLAERIIAHPILLDDLLDSRSELYVPSEDELRRDIEEQLHRHGDDVEASLQALNEIRQSLSFRIGLATLFQRQSASASARQLAELAEQIVAAVLRLAIRSLEPAHGVLPGYGTDAGLAIIGYGSLGGLELGFASDLDLVFLYDRACEALMTDGSRSLDAGRYQMRVVQKALSLLSTLTSAGRLYEVDLRLRPDGAKGLLMVSLDSFADYQRQRAWTWEHQALVRARPVAGAPALAVGFQRLRNEVLSRGREREDLIADLVRMRQRMRSELDRGRQGQFDLKQGQGGLVDIEFMLQASVIYLSPQYPDLLLSTASGDLLARLAEIAAPADWPIRAGALLEAYELLLARGLTCTLDGRPRVVMEEVAIESARAQVRQQWQALGLHPAED
ncbi:bifunctional [glutamate--ammonia ligase]-adenylyl-L-tyrosine phosphorylase/[glutamate--ammonia-ligase] adenylyltransferase [Pseudomarimonas arenosa]|nr:bifunctional [glutamate--ammonia ligase]-adenylyl-L-tyrosine phosphorylase/[glutamate--ammonia-ligase] adenylyltransferase [Pseudomarimonas arenosa]